MARRRSANRRLSRKSMNITELDDDSELIDRDNPMWWKNIEGDMTIHQSRRSFYTDTTTSNILDADSRVDPSELKDEWWNKLDKTNRETRRISASRSFKPTETSYESSKSDDMDDVSIKKRKILLRARAHKSGTTDNFAQALADSDAVVLSQPLPGEKRKSKSDLKSDSEIARKKVRKIRDKGGANSPEENDDDTSVNTSNDSDVVMKTRPKPFKKRFTKLPHGLFDDILKHDTAGPSGINSVPQTSQNEDSAAKNSPTKRRTSFSNKSLTGLDTRTKTPTKFRDSAESQLMGPPRTSPHRKRLSSISRKLNLTSDEGESDGGLRKTRLGFVKKNRDNLSINAFDDILNEHLEEGRPVEDRGEKDLSFGAGTGNEGRIDPKTSEFQGSQQEMNRRSISVIKENPAIPSKRSDLQGRSNSMRKSFIAKDLQRIEKIIENDETNRSDKLSKSLGRTSMEKKMLEVSLIRISPRIMESQRINEEEPNNEREVENAKIRSLRSLSQNRIADSAYELPDKDRSTTPMISASESENEKSPAKNLTRTSSRASLRSNREANKSKRESIERSMRNETRASISRKINASGNYSQTKFFSDEDISVEDLDEVRERNLILEQSQAGNEKADGSTKSFAGSKKSVKRGRIDEDIRDEKEDVEKMEEESSHFQNEKKARTSKTSYAAANKSQKNIHSDESEDGAESAEETNSKSLNSQLATKSRTSKNSFAGTNKSQKSFPSAKKISEDEPEKTEKADKTSSTSRLSEKSRTTRESVMFTNKSRKTVESDESLSENEEKRKSKSSNSQFEEATDTSSVVITPRNKHRQRVESDESISEDEVENVEKTDTKSSNSQVEKETRTSTKGLTPINKSRQSIESGESLSENLSEEVTKSNTKSSFSHHQKNTRLSTKILASANKSRQSIESDESISDDEVENVEKTDTKSSNSQVEKKTRTSTKILAPTNKSRQSIESGESLSENASEEAAKSNTKSSFSHLQKNTRLSTKILVSANKSRQSIESGESLSENESEEAAKSSMSHHEKNSRTPRKSLASVNKSPQSIESDESISENEAENVEKSNLKSSNSQIRNKTRTSTESGEPPNKSGRIIESHESPSEDEVENVEKTNSKTSHSRLENKTRPLRKSLAPVNKSQRIQPENEMNEGEAQNAKKSFSITTQTGEGSKNDESSARVKVSQQVFESDERFEDAVEEENLLREGKTKKTIGLSRNSSMIRNSMNRNESSPSARKNDQNNLSETISTPSENIPVSSKLNILPNKRITSLVNRSNVSQSQRNITDFFTSKFLQKSDNATTRENATSFDKEKLSLIKMRMEKLRKQEMEKMAVIAKKKEMNVPKRPGNFSKTKNSRTQENTPAKTKKAIDKAYIVNGVVYKRPRLPRPKPWVTDRLYRHLWKFMEPKYKLATRVKSEKFVQQLSEIVALTIRRKKYENYKVEVDALMKEMARLGIVKTRNDFYDFCYDFLPYDFRVKVTPILLPGNVSTIPYDPAKLHTPILQTP